MSFTTPLLGYDRGPGATVTGISLPGGVYDDLWGLVDYLPWLQTDAYLPPDQRPNALPALGQGIAEGESVGYDPSEPTVPQVTEVCWVNAGDGSVACFPANSVFQPGGIWGPAGTWFPESAYHPPPIDPEYIPTRRVEEPVGDTVPLHEEAGWVQGLLGLGTQILGGVAGVSPVPSFVGTPTNIPVPNGAAMPTSYSGSCPPRKTRTLTIDCATGQEVKRTRRRRRRLLTSSDLGDLAQLQALVGKGSNAMSVAVSKAIR